MFNRVVLIAVVVTSVSAARTVRAKSPSQAVSPSSDSCGTPAALAAGEALQQPVFPGGYPVVLPAVSPAGVRNDLPNPYRAGVEWGQLPAGRQWGSTASVTLAPDGTLWVMDRCGSPAVGGSSCDGASATINPIFQFDTAGNRLKNIGAGLFVAPHKLTIDADGNLWVADNGGHQVFKLDQNGKVLMTLGQRGKVGSGHDLFDAPTEVAVATNGDFYVADGHTGGGGPDGNARIVKFDKTGKFLKAWGRKGMGPGEFDVVHTIALDSRGRVFAGDRQNNRIQIFDADGNFIAQWMQFGRPSGIYIDKRSDTMYVADSESRDARTNTGRNALVAATAYGFNLGVRRGIRIGSAKNGKVTGFIPDPCPYPYASISTLAEGVTIDREGNVYGSDFLRHVRKFVKKQP
jgi:sugar lactone lactonase YvrE